MAESTIRLNSEYDLEVARGNVTGVTSVNKFGRNRDIDTVSVEDVWIVGGTWVAPTTARTHNIASSAGADSSAGNGARTIRIFGLTSWGSSEVSEDITMNGTSNVATAASYVIIYRMKVLTSGSTSINVGDISATAQTDGTVTARIEADSGQTQLAIFAIPSTQTAYISRMYGNVLKGGSGSVGDFNLFINPNPNVQLTNFIRRHTFVSSSNTSINFRLPIKIEGPAIIKINCGVSANNADVSAGFDLYLVDN